jgi:hypothetical protein
VAWNTKASAGALVIRLYSFPNTPSQKSPAQFLALDLAPVVTLCSIFPMPQRFLLEKIYLNTPVDEQLYSPAQMGLWQLSSLSGPLLGKRPH